MRWWILGLLFVVACPSGDPSVDDDDVSDDDDAEGPELDDDDAGDGVDDDDTPGEDAPEGPVAVCGATQTIPLGAGAQYDGTASISPDGGGLTYAWGLAQGELPVATVMELDDTASPTPELVRGDGSVGGVDRPGLYRAFLTVTDDQGRVSLPCVQDVVVHPDARLVVQTYWSQPDDIDLHLLAPGGTFRDQEGGTDCFYANCVGAFATVDWGVLGDPTDDPSLDLDDINGTGPELTQLPDPALGIYTVVVHDYRGTVNDHSRTNVTVEIFVDGVKTTFERTIEGENVAHYVAQIGWPSGTITPCDGPAGC